MSTCGVQSSGAIELLFYGELPDGERVEVERHLRACEDCRQAFADLTTIREALASRPDIGSPPGGDWSAFMARLDRAVRRERSDARDGTLVSARQWWKAGLPGMRPAYASAAVAAVLTLVTVAVLLVGRDRGEVAGPDQGDVARPALVAADAPIRLDDPGLTAVSEQHFERSKLVVLGLATKDPEGGSGSNWAYEQELASALLDDTRLYRIAAEQRGMDTLAGVMRDLELLLLEASMSEQPDAASLETLQGLIRRRDLLTKMEVVGTSGT
jgi:hypothetical protein